MGHQTPDRAQKGRRGVKYPITPVAKPRMTQSDKWKKRPAVLKYRAFCDEVRLRGVKIPHCGAHITFIIPMPKSWGKRVKSEAVHSPHQAKPDVDNLLKALLDAIYDDDSCVWDIRATKVWGYEGGIEVES